MLLFNLNLECSLTQNIPVYGPRLSSEFVILVLHVHIAFAAQLVIWKAERVPQSNDIAYLKHQRFTLQYSSHLVIPSVYF